MSESKVGEFLQISTYIMMERRKKPRDREFNIALDLWPRDCRDFPIMFNKYELEYLEGCHLHSYITGI